MLRPVQWQIDTFRQLLCRELNGLGPRENARNDVGRQEGKRDQVGHIAAADAFGPCHLRKRLGLAAPDQLEPLPSTYDRSNKGRINSGVACARLRTLEYESHLDPATPETGWGHMRNDYPFSAKETR